ncbi:homeobox protein 10-like [Bombus pyrosoma]|uniref:homeobox protein 10-like n=1 Tax=Bombus pyrosoma TaxID=396416 RepID=UPI001CB8F8DC|nr:homeobox protein 10-like [Bombus pyrosoma]
MKSVRKPKDFSIESILADKFRFLRNDQYINPSQFSVTKTHELDLQKEKFEKNIGTAFEISIEEDVAVNTKNNFASIKENPAPNPAQNLPTNFGIGTRDTYRINNVFKNNEFSDAEDYGVYFQRKSEVNVEENDEVNFKIINFKQYKDEEHCISLLNTEENNIVNQSYKISKFDIIGKCTTDMKRSCLIADEKKHMTVYQHFSKPLEQEEFNSNEISDSKITTHTGKGLVTNSEYVKPKKGDEYYEKINERYGNVNINEQQNNIINLKLTKIENRSPSFDNMKEKLINLLNNKTDYVEVMKNATELEWLRCTRYKPPKIPRKRAIGKNRRKPSLHPRIPFSTFQLDFLEQQFQNNAYLSKDNVLEISNVLNLPPNRIKIWFQNRRARERREFCINI